MLSCTTPPGVAPKSNEYRPSGPELDDGAIPNVTRPVEEGETGTTVLGFDVRG